MGRATRHQIVRLVIALGSSLCSWLGGTASPAIAVGRRSDAVPPLYERRCGIRCRLNSNILCG
jgi:hypothetical protein